MSLFGVAVVLEWTLNDGKFSFRMHFVCVECLRGLWCSNRTEWMVLVVDLVCKSGCVCQESLEMWINLWFGNCFFFIDRYFYVCISCRHTKYEYMCWWTFKCIFCVWKMCVLNDQKDCCTKLGIWEYVFLRSDEWWMVLEKGEFVYFYYYFTNVW